MSILVAEKLGKSYSGFQAVRDVSFALEAGEMLALIGPNGAGKSTCFAMIDGQLAPTTGRITIFGKSTAGMAPRERHALMGLTARIARERAIGVLFTEHDMDVVFGHADRVLVLNRGTLIAEGPPAAVRANAEIQAVYPGSGSLYGYPR